MPSQNTNHNCIHEEAIQEHSVQIKGLETRADFKDKRIDEINTKMDKMEKKLDDLSDNVNKLLLQSTQDDGQLEIRLTKIETDMENQKLEAQRDMEKQKLETQRRTAWIGMGLTILTILINLYFNMIH